MTRHRSTRPATHRRLRRPALAVLVAAALGVGALPAALPAAAATPGPPPVDVWSPGTVQHGPYEGRPSPVEGLGVPAGPVQPAVTAPAAGTELTGLRGASRKVLATGQPGGHRAEAYAQPVHYQDAQGRWQPIDSSLVSRSAGLLGNRSGQVGIDFATTADATPLVGVRLPGGTSAGFGLTGAAASPGVVSGATVTYAQALPLVDVRLTSRAEGVKEELVLASPGAPRSFDFPLALTGLTAEISPAGALLLRDSKGAVAASAARGWMSDAAGVGASQPGALSEGVTYSLVTTAAGPVLHMALDAGWLADPARAYPVTVDPPIAMEREIGATFIAQDAAATNFDSDSALRVGRWNATTASVRRSLLQFDLTPYNAATIYSANLRLYNWDSTTCAARSTVVKRVTAAFSSSTVTWANQPTTDATALATVSESHGNETLGCANAPILYDTTAAVRNWVNAPGKTATWPNYGIGIWAGSETDTSYAKSFNAENINLTDPPVYVIDYDNAPNVPVLTGPAWGWRYTYNPVLSASYSDKDADAGKVTFTVTDRNGAVMRTLTSAQVASGSTATVDLATNPLPTGWYAWSATASDGRQSSAATGSRKLEISPADAGTPGVGIKGFYHFEDFALADRTQLRVNVANGNLLLRQKDLAIRGTAGHDLTLERTYNSQRAQTRELGTGWALGAGQQTGLYHAAGNAGRDLVYEDQNQTRWAFTYNATTNGWTAPIGLNATLTRSTTNSDYLLVYNQSNRKLTFWDSGPLTLIEDRNGNKIDPQFDSTEYVKRIVDSQTRATAFNSSASGRLNSITDPAGRTASYTYTGDNLTSALDLAGKSWTYGYGTELTTVTDPRGNATKISYTTGSRVSAVTRITDKVAGTGPTTSFAYYAAGTCPNTNITAKCTVVTDPNGNTTTSGSDSDGKITKTYDGAGHKRESGYDTLGNVTALTGDGTTPTSQVSYVAGSYKVSGVNDGPAGSSTFTYSTNSGDSPASYRTPQGSGLDYTYRSDDGLLSSIKTANGAEDRYRLSYNVDGTLSSYSQPNLVTTADTTDRVTTSLSYTDGNLVGINFPLPLGNAAYTVDAYARRLSQSDGNTKVTNYGYDNLDRVTRIAFASGAALTFGYDANGNQTTRTYTAAGATSGKTTTDTYDELNRLVTEDKPSPASTVALTYDGVGNLRTYTDPSGTVDYRYNTVNLLAQLLEPDGASTTFGYDNDNNRTRTSYPNTVVQDLTYSKANQVKTIKATRGTTTLLDLAYDYRKSSASTADDTNLRSKVTDALKGQGVDYAYEAEFSQLKSATTKSTATGSTVTALSYLYDGNGARTRSTVDGVDTNYSYNSAGQLLAVSAGPAVGQYTFDGNGALTSGGGLTLGYNDHDQTTSVNGTAVSYEDHNQGQRDALGSRAFLNTPLGVSRYTDSAQTTAVTRESTGQLVSLRRTSGSARSYPLTDALGSVLGLTDSAGTQTDTFAYDPYGSSTARTGSTENPFRFTGEYQDPSGLYKIGQRYYQSQTGRWTQTDPARRATNPASPPEASPYLYVGNNPVNYTDPTGAGLSLRGFAIIVVEEFFAGTFCTALGIGLGAATLGPGIAAGIACGITLNAGFAAAGVE